MVFRVVREFGAGKQLFSGRFRFSPNGFALETILQERGVQAALAFDTASLESSSFIHALARNGVSGSSPPIST